MSDISKEEILHLGNLARIKLSKTEVESLVGDMNSILDYVSQIDAVVPSGEIEKKVGAVYNVFREDEVTNDPGKESETLSAEFPERDGPYLRVKKILNPDA